MPGADNVGRTPLLHATPALAEADRLMVVCNSCRYCEGLCPVFPAMEMRRAFLDADLNYLANLCHNCGACYEACQFSPPHEFSVNVPEALAVVRNDSYRAYAWPRALRGLFDRNPLALAIITACAAFAFLLIMLSRAAEAPWQPAELSGEFYRLIPHDALAYLFGAAFLYAIAAIAMGLRSFWKDLGEPSRTLVQSNALFPALTDASRLRFLDGGKGGCGTEQPTDPRKLYHHLTFYGFLLCFLATVMATLYHYVLGRQAPYAWYDLPVIAGTLGGLGLLGGPAGLLTEKLRRPRHLTDPRAMSMEVTFIVMLFLTSLTGLALLPLRATAAMPVLLAIHLGVVLALFVTLPYSKFVHGIYRYLALVRYARESATVSSDGG